MSVRPGIQRLRDEGWSVVFRSAFWPPTCRSHAFKHRHHHLPRQRPADLNCRTRTAHCIHARSDPESSSIIPAIAHKHRAPALIGGVRQWRNDHSRAAEPPAKACSLPRSLAMNRSPHQSPQVVMPSHHLHLYRFIKQRRLMKQRKPVTMWRCNHRRNMHEARHECTRHIHRGSA